ncbi:hypothetical protein BGZ63DRAFT_354734 [Mariannaea sp. PMI_226]|nr:hypothetical protein BGZ63DRAFT_354734 [Mariannaea sp. PMI_226]
MSSQKKRRLDGLETPKPMSAISALAARRREAASAAASASSTPSDDEDKSIIRTPNFFSPLQKSGDSTSATKPSNKGTPKSARNQRGSQPQATRLSGVESPRDLPQTFNAESVSPLRNITQFSSFRPTKKNSRKRDGGIVEFRFEESERFMILGSYGIRVVRGEVTVAGAHLRPSDTIHWIHAPSCHAIPVLRSAENSGIELHPDPNSRGLRQLGRLSPLFRKMWNQPTDEAEKKNAKEATFQILFSSEDAPKRLIIQDLVSPPEWNKQLASSVSAARKKPSLLTLVCGPKSAGKSTFSRLLTNRLLTDRALAQGSKGVVILDLDPGQPEYVPAGILSLVHVTEPNLSAPFTHPGNPNSPNWVIRCHSIASVTPASDPDLYLECAQDLYNTYCNSFQGTPLIVNTPGWILGTGLDLISSMIERINPDEVLYMSEDGPLETVDTLQSVTKTTFTELPSQQSEFTSRTAAHFRAMQTMSYFHLHEQFRNSSEPAQPMSHTKWSASPLSSKPPLLVRYSSPKPGILGFLSYDSQAPRELLADAVNGTILAVVEIEDPRAFRNLKRCGQSDQSTETIDLDTTTLAQPKLSLSRSPEDLPFIPNYNDITLDPKYSRTLGLVLLRGIDNRSKTLQLLTPIPENVIKDVRSKDRDIILIHGKFDPPNWAYTEDLYEQNGQDEGYGGPFDIMDDDTDEESPKPELEETDKTGNLTAAPWVEVLKGSEKRPIGSSVWRVRRDLGRNSGD